MVKLQETKRACGRFDKDSVKLTPYLGLLERPGGGCYVFNQTYFSPVKIEGEIDKVHEFFKRINDKGVKHLKSDLINLLLHSRILTPNEDKAKPADKWTRKEWEMAWKHEPFTIIFDEKYDLKVILKNLKVHLENLFYPEKTNILTVKNIVIHSSISDILSKFDEIYKFLQILKYPFKINWVIDVPIKWLQNHQAEFKTIKSPHIRFCSHLRNKLDKEDLKAIGFLIDEGFCPHLTLWISDINAAKKTFSQIANCFGKDGFTYDFKLEKEMITQSATEISDFVYQCHFHKELLLRQSYIYTEILNRIQRNGIGNFFIDGESTGRTLILENQKRFKITTDLKGYGQSSWVTELKKKMFGEYSCSKEKCRLCPVRYLCGGISDINLAEINCDIKKRLICKILEESTEPPKIKQKIEFVSVYGSIKIRKAG